MTFSFQQDGGSTVQLAPVTGLCTDQDSTCRHWQGVELSGLTLKTIELLHQHSKMTCVTLSLHLQVGFVDDTAALTISDMARRAAQFGRQVCSMPDMLPV